jgi:hypothetical protein
MLSIPEDKKFKLACKYIGYEYKDKPKKFKYNPNIPFYFYMKHILEIMYWQNPMDDMYTEFIKEKLDI